MILVPQDSPLRRMPTDLSRREVLFLDGVRYCFEIFDMASTRLAETFRALEVRKSETEHLSSLIVGAISDAWVMIDSVHRLRDLLEQVPRLKKKAPQLQLFLRRTAAAKELRNFAQHFRTEIDDYSQRGMPLWGTLAWVSDDADIEAPINHVIVPGTWFRDELVQGCVFDTIEDRYIQRVVLRAGEKAVELFDLSESVREFAEWFTEWFSCSFNCDECHGADLHIRLAKIPCHKPANEDVGE